MKRAIFGSLLIHLAILALFLNAGSGIDGNCEGPNCSDKKSENAGTGNSDDDKREIVDKPVQISPVSPEVLEAIKKQNEQIKLEEEQKKEQARLEKEAKECPLWFGGIGVTFNSLEGRVLTVHRGYPAEAAGIQPGDYLTSDTEIKGQVGTPVVVQVTRGTLVYTLTLIRAKICVVHDGPK
jgi:hypothetical protein